MRIIALLLFFLSGIALQAQSGGPTSARPICGDSAIVYSAGVNQDPAFPNNIGCLTTSPNPAWFYFQLDTPGNLAFTISTSPARDIDFILWGPFATLELANMAQYTDFSEDCSYSSSTTETVNVTGGQAGEYYILLVTNYSNQNTNITFSKTTGTAGINCDLYGASVNSPVCVGNTIQFNSGLNESEYSFQWSGPNNFSSTIRNPAIPNATLADTGIYTVIVTKQGLSDTFNLHVRVEELPVPVITGSLGICPGGLATTTLSGPTGFTYRWQNVTNPSNPVNIGAGRTVSVGAGSYKLIVTSPAGCVGESEVVNVVPRDPFQPVIQGPNFTCFDEPALLSTTENYQTYYWSNNSEDPTTTVISGTYDVTVTDEYGCSGKSAPFTVINNRPEAKIEGLGVFCKDESLLLSAEGQFANYQWLRNGQQVGTESTYEYTGGKLTLIVSDQNGCADTVTVEAYPLPRPTAFFTHTPASPVMFNTPISFTDGSTAASNDPIVEYHWTFTPPGEDDYTQNPTYLYPDTGSKEARLIVTSGFGCKDTFTVQIRVIEKPFAPNAFSPNGDALNQYFVIPFIQDYPGNTVSIYNRWGKRIFHTNDYKNDWDGGNAPSGTYFYVIDIPTLESLKGSFTLFRD